MGNLLDSLKGLASNELVSAASKSLGESEGGIGKAIGAILPSILGGVMNSNSGSHSVLSDLLTKAGGNNNMIGDLIGGITSGKTDSPAMSIGGGLLKSLFGDKVAGIANLISNFAGIKSGSSQSLLGIGGSLIASFLGKKMLGEGLNFGGIMNWLSGQKNEIESAIPSGFSTLLSGAGSVANKAAAATSHAAGHVTGALGGDDDSKGGGMKWLLPVILLGLLGAFLWYWLQGSKEDHSGGTGHATEMHDADANHDHGDAAHQEVSATAETPAVAAGSLNADGDWVATHGAAKKIKLKNGVEIDAYEGFLEDKLVKFIDDAAAVPGDKAWLNFEELLFETGKSTLKPGGEKQIANAVEILKAYPNLKVKVGGYTDNQGDSVKNETLSDARAKTVYNKLISSGAAKTSFDAEEPFDGYGQRHPVADNNTPEGRAQNRRISFGIRAK
jgi:OmpA-OmpF porin, OOP family